MKKIFLYIPEKFLVGYSNNLKVFFTKYYFQYASDIIYHSDDEISFYNQKYCAEMKLTAEPIKNNESCLMKFV